MLPVLLVSFVWALWGLLGARRELSPLVFVAAILGSLFFASLPLANAVAYSEAAHRSWAFSFLGFAVVLGVAGGLALEGRLAITVRTHRLWPLQARWHRGLRPVLAACVVVVAIGSVSVGSSVAVPIRGLPSRSRPTPCTSARRPRWSPRGSPDTQRQARRRVGEPVRRAPHRDRVEDQGRLAWGVATSAPLQADRSPPRCSTPSRRVNYIVFNRFTGAVGGVPAWFWYVPSDSLLPKDERTTAFPGRLGCLDWANAVFATTTTRCSESIRPASLRTRRVGTMGSSPVACSSGGSANELAGGSSRALDLGVGALGVVGLALLGIAVLLSPGGTLGTVRTVVGCLALLGIPAWLLGRLVDEDSDAIGRRDGWPDRHAGRVRTVWVRRLRAEPSRRDRSVRDPTARPCCDRRTAWVDLPTGAARPGCSADGRPRARPRGAPRRAGEPTSRCRRRRSRGRSRFGRRRQQPQPVTSSSRLP